jgi:hypothetical protein
MHRPLSLSQRTMLEQSQISDYTAELDIHKLNAAASKAHVFPGMANHSLLSVGQLCDENYIITFKRALVTICNSEKSQILSGPRDLNTGLWRINLKQTNHHIPEPIANNVYELRNTGALVHYLHKALFSPTKYAMLQAVKDGHLITWPGLTEDAINKHLKLIPATSTGHMNQGRQNIRSTSKAPIEKQQTPDTDLGTKIHLVYAVVVDQGQVYTDLTGKFPVRSSKGNYYVMVCYVYDCNYVKVAPIKSRSASEWVKAYDIIHKELTVKGFKPKLQTLDNEASAALKIFSPLMMSITKWCRLTSIAATPRNAPSGLSKKTLWPGSPQLTRPSQCTCGTDSYRRRKSR